MISMVLRKPYAFLVKHFRLIHTVLLLLMLFIVYKLYAVLSFYNDYIGSTLVGYDYPTIAGTFASFFTILAILLVLFISGVLLYLLIYKRKPITIYAVILAVYVLVFIMIIFSVIYVSGFQFSLPSPIVIRIVRDIILILFVTQIVLLGLVFVRAIGFDIKKFDFKKDVQDLGITDEDNEEFEFEINVDAQDYITKIKKRIRYFKYYYRENIVVFYGIYALIAIFVVSSVVSFLTSLEHVYKENESYQVGAISYKVTKSYRTLNNSKGNRINDKYYYVIVKVKAKNVSNYRATISTNNMKLIYDGTHSVTPTKKVYDNFKEYGTQYYNQILNPGEEKSYIFIFEAPIEAYSRRLMLRTLYTAYRDKNGVVQFGYRSVRLNPEIDKKEQTTVVTKNLGEEMSFEGSIFGKTTIRIDDFKLADTFYYNLVNCTEESCRTMKGNVSASSKQSVSLTVMRLKYKLKFDTETVGSNYSVNDFIARFGRIRYVVNGVKENKPMNHNLILKDLTPLYTNQISFIEVKNILNRADIIYLDFTIRDKIYTYILKDDLTNKEKKKEKEKEKIENLLGTDPTKEIES